MSDAKREPVTHELKSWPRFFDAVFSNVRMHDMRYNDRFFQVDDRVKLLEFNPHKGEYTGRDLMLRITCIDGGKVFEQWGLMPGYVVLGLAKV